MDVEDAAQIFAPAKSAFPPSMAVVLQEQKSAKARIGALVMAQRIQGFPGGLGVLCERDGWKPIHNEKQSIRE